MREKEEDGNIAKEGEGKRKRKEVEEKEADEKEEDKKKAINVWEKDNIL